MDAFISVRNKVNLESLIEKEELDKLKEIRFQETPARIVQLGEGVAATRETSTDGWKANATSNGCAYWHFVCW